MVYSMVKRCSNKRQTVSTACLHCNDVLDGDPVFFPQLVLGTSNATWRYVASSRTTTILVVVIKDSRAAILQQT